MYRFGQWVGQTGIPSFGIQHRGQSKLSFNVFPPRKSFLLHSVDAYHSSLSLWESETETHFLPLPPFPHWTPLCSWWSCRSFKNLLCKNEFHLGLFSSFEDKVQDIADLTVRKYSGRSDIQLLTVTSNLMYFLVCFSVNLNDATEIFSSNYSVRSCLATVMSSFFQDCKRDMLGWECLMFFYCFKFIKPSDSLIVRMCLLHLCPKV